MKMKPVTDDAPVEGLRLTRLELANEAVNRAVADVAGIEREYKDWQAKHNLVVDVSGNILYCEVPAGNVRSAFEQISRDLVKRHRTAMAAFNASLEEFAVAKQEAQCPKS